MAITLVEDVIVPEIFIPYVQNRTAELTAFIQSGIIDNDPQFAALAAGGGKTVEMPYWNDLDSSDEEEVDSDVDDIPLSGIDASEDVAVINTRRKGWGANDLAGILAGSSPSTAIGDLVATYWARRTQKLTFKYLEGAMGAANMSDLVHDIHSADGTVDATTTLNGLTFLDAKQRLGDAKSNLVGIAMHSAVATSLLKQDLIDYIPASDGKSMLATFQGLSVTEDDGCTEETIAGKKVYTTYLFGRGAIALGFDPTIRPIAFGGTAGSTWNVEFSRDSKKSQSELINRRRFIIHIRGIKWVGGATTRKGGPSNAELATGTNWTRVYDTKLIRVVKVRHNIYI